jgi:hypothetical protein
LTQTDAESALRVLEGGESLVEGGDAGEIVAAVGEGAGEGAGEIVDEDADWAADSEQVEAFAVDMPADASLEPSLGDVSATGDAVSHHGPPVSTVVMGPRGRESDGTQGRVHSVVPGDTLWDISDVYLGSAWVWPSVWKDNSEIANPHVIHPGDRIWIAPGEMRIVTSLEADALIAAEREVAKSIDVPASEAAWDSLEPAEMLESPASDDMLADELPVAMDQFEVPTARDGLASNYAASSIRVAEREAMGFVSTDVVAAATSIVDSPSPRTLLVDGDMVYLGVAEGDAQLGDEFTIFRDAEAVVDYKSERVLGYHVDILGWAIVREVHGETVTAEVRMSFSEMRRGDRVIPRAPVSLKVPIKSTPEGEEGKIVFMPNDRTRMGDGDYVYLNRGELHGFQVGSQVEVFYPGRLLKDKVTRQRVMTPDLVVAKMILVEVKDDTAVAYVVTSDRELEIGDRVRPVARKLASR